MCVGAYTLCFLFLYMRVRACKFVSLHMLQVFRETEFIIAKQVAICWNSEAETQWWFNVSSIAIECKWLCVCKWCWVDLQYMKTLSITTPPRRLFSPHLGPDFNIMRACCICIHVRQCMFVTLQKLSCLMRTSLPAHPKHPHNPATVETAFSSLSCFAVAKCWSTTNTPECLDTHDLKPSVL